MEAVNQYLIEVKNRKQKIIQDYNLPKSIKFLSEILAHSIWWQDDRKGVAWRVHAVLDKLSEWAARMFEVPFESLMLYRAEEWSELFETSQKVETKIITERQKLAIFVLNKKGVTEYRDTGAKKAKSKYFSADESVAPKNISELSGTKVSVGVARGKVRILLSPKNVGFMKEGEKRRGDFSCANDFSRLHFSYEIGQRYNH